MSGRIPLALAAGLVALLGSGVARAHLGLLDPPSRYGRTVLKQGPCGMTGGARGEPVLALEPGATILLRWEEYVDHPSHYRIAFDPDGEDDFVDPATQDELYSNDAVLLDGIADGRGGVHEESVTLPDVECERCTLQVVQVMYDKPPYGDGNDLYYQCVDFTMRRGSGDAGSGDAGPGDAGGGDAGVRPPTGSGSGGCAVVAARGREGAGVGVFLIGLGLLLRRARARARARARGDA